MFKYMVNKSFRVMLALVFYLLGFGAYAQDTTLHVYKSLTCGCCIKWIDHLNDSNISTTFSDTNQLPGIKAKLGIARPYQSCHTAITKDGYVFEGHVPAKFVKQFLDKPPENALGLSVPAMPVGTPGMEMGDEFQAYQVLLLKKDGGVRVFAEVNTKEQQF